MFQLPQVVQEVFQEFESIFRRRTAQRMQWLVLGAILLRGSRSFTRILRLLSGLIPGHFSTFYRLFSRPRWSTWKVGRILARLIIESAPPGEVITVLCDSTVSEHPGRRVYGKDKHRDAVRSSHSFTAWRWGHKRVVLTVALPVPFVRRRWALPVMVALYRSQNLNNREGRRHKTQAQLARQMMRILLAWFPERSFVLVGDGDFSSHEMAAFARRFRERLSFVGHFYSNAGLYDPPPAYSGNGRPRVKGAKRPKPEEVVATSARAWKTCVDWYGGERRRVAIRSGEGHWYRGGCGLAHIRWVYVEDRQGTHRPESFFSTDPTMSTKQIVEYYTLRWSIETTFQEVRAHLGFATTRHWSQTAVERVEPWLLVLFSIVTLIYIRHLQTHGPKIQQWPWYHKGEPTFADALTTVRRLIWVESIFAHPFFASGIQKLPPKARDKVLHYLTLAA